VAEEEQMTAVPVQKALLGKLNPKGMSHPKPGKAK
jgi:hypothetical protein